MCTTERCLWTRETMVSLLRDVCEQEKLLVNMKIQYQFKYRKMFKNIFLVKALLIYNSRSILKCSHGAFVTFIQENGVPRGRLQLLGFFHYNFWHKMLTLNEISSCIGTPRGLVLVYVVLRPIIYKTVSRISDRINRTNFTHN